VTEEKKREEIKRGCFVSEFLPHISPPEHFRLWGKERAATKVGGGSRLCRNSHILPVSRGKAIRGKKERRKNEVTTDEAAHELRYLRAWGAGKRKKPN